MRMGVGIDHVAALRAARRHRGQRARSFGIVAEWLAVMVLWLKGYRIVARRLRTPRGEIDIIARRQTILAIVEVKARRHAYDAAGAVSARQRQRLEQAASTFLARKPTYASHSVRFDVVIVAPWQLPRHVTDAWRSGL